MSRCPPALGSAVGSGGGEWHGWRGRGSQKRAGGRVALVGAIGRERKYCGRAAGGRRAGAGEGASDNWWVAGAATASVQRSAGRRGRLGARSATTLCLLLVYAPATRRPPAERLTPVAACPPAPAALRWPTNVMLCLLGVADLWRLRYLRILRRRWHPWPPGMLLTPSLAAAMGTLDVKSAMVAVVGTLGALDATWTKDANKVAEVMSRERHVSGMSAPHERHV